METSFNVFQTLHFDKFLKEIGKLSAKYAFCDMFLTMNRVYCYFFAQIQQKL